MPDDSPFNPFQAPVADAEITATFSDGRQIIYAGYGRRIVAHLIDTFNCWAMLATVGLIASQFKLGGPNTLYVVLGLLFGLPWAYYVFQESSAARATIGKRWLGLAVTDRAGNQISKRRATFRFLGKIFVFTLMSLESQTLPRMLMTHQIHVIIYATLMLLTLALFLIDYLTPLINMKHQAVHDMIAGCLVVKAGS